jgi:hypothetical protein
VVAGDHEGTDGRIIELISASSVLEDTEAYNPEDHRYPSVTNLLRLLDQTRRYNLTAVPFLAARSSVLHTLTFMIKAIGTD